jgi:hypothetical protein
MGGGGGLFYFKIYLSNRSITSVMPWAVGCLTRENTKECWAFIAQCRALFVDFFHLQLLLVTFFTAHKFCNYYLLLRGVMFVIFLLLFLLFISFKKLLFTVEKGQGLYWVDCARGGLGVHLDAFF